jgi:hypothetical protein
MALQTFTAGQVLTAAQVNALQANDYNQTVSTKTADYTLVAADKGTRVEMNSGSATTITVNTDLFNAGDTLFIQNIGAGVCTITAGTATVSTAGSLALVENAGGTLYFISTGVAVFYPSGVAASSGGLTLITSTTASAVTSISVDNCFSATYRNYRITVTYAGASATTTDTLRFRVAGADNTASEYYDAGFLVRPGGTTAGFGASAATSFTNFWGHSTAPNVAFSADFFVPFVTENTKFNILGFAQDGTGLYSRFGGGLFNATTSFTGFTLISSSGTISATVKVYGYKD